MAWDKLGMEKEFGGLGIKNLKNMNQSFLAKLAWRLVTNHDHLRARILWAKYGSSFGPKAKNQGTSYIWKSILTGVEILTKVALSQTTWTLPEINNGIQVKDIYGAIRPSEQSQDSDGWKKFGNSRDLLAEPHYVICLTWDVAHSQSPLREALHWTQYMQTLKQGSQDLLHALRNCTWCFPIWKWLVRRSE